MVINIWHSLSVCREYVDERGSYVMRTERSGLGLAPFDPAQNSTATLVGEELYAGTVADIMGVDPIIFRYVRKILLVVASRRREENP